MLACEVESFLQVLFRQPRCYDVMDVAPSYVKDTVSQQTSWFSHAYSLSGMFSESHAWGCVVDVSPHRNADIFL